MEEHGKESESDRGSSGSSDNVEVEVPDCPSGDIPNKDLETPDEDMEGTSIHLDIDYTLMQLR